MNLKSLNVGVITRRQQKLTRSRQRSRALSKNENFAAALGSHSASGKRPAWTRAAWPGMRGSALRSAAAGSYHKVLALEYPLPEIY
ncbi:MAG: hypothetical protein DYG95_28995 [Chlorobi bacterium CHB1]|nr:hypothetical protein [Chlorobi bacterium CHB1]